MSEKLELVVKLCATQPVAFVTQVLGATPDPWQCDVLDAVSEFGNVAVRACHGVGKTALLAWAVHWFTMTRPYSKVPTTAPTFNKQVRDVLWAEIHRWYRHGLRHGTPGLAWVLRRFELTQTRLQAVEAPTEWFAAGIASGDPLNIEGYHSAHILVVFDEAKGIGRPIWEAVQGMRTTQEAKMLVASTPGGPVGEFFNVFTKYRSTWKSLFIVHPEALRSILKRPEASVHSRRGTYYSPRVRAEWVNDRREEWGHDSPVFTARAIGDFPTVADDVLIPYAWLSEAEDLDTGKPGPTIVACDVARYGRDRTVILGGHGGTLVHGETIAKTPAESFVPKDVRTDVGDNPRQPRYRSVTATADACLRVRNLLNADCIVIDDSGIGGGVTDILRKQGERVIPINFGTTPTDRPRDAEEHALRTRRHLLDSKYVNLKAEMGWAVRSAFESGAIALRPLPPPVRDALIAQASMVKYEMDSAGRLRLLDPDDQDDLVLSVDSAAEGRKSPDHFHALLLYWWVAAALAKAIRPLAGTPANILLGVTRLGSPARRIGMAIGGSLPAHTASGRAGGQAAWVQRWYGPY